MAVLASTRVADFAEALAGGTTLGGFDELKKRPPGGFENREYDLFEGCCMGRRNLGNIVHGWGEQGRLSMTGWEGTGSVGHMTRFAGTRDAMAEVAREPPSDAISTSQSPVFISH